MAMAMAMAMALSFTMRQILQMIPCAELCHANVRARIAKCYRLAMPMPSVGVEFPQAVYNLHPATTVPLYKISANATATSTKLML